MSATKLRTGGPAFPVIGPGGKDSNGMTLRDYFAAAALPAVITYLSKEIEDFCFSAEDKLGDEVTSYDTKMICEEAYRVADAMLIEREIL